MTRLSCSFHHLFLTISCLTQHNHKMITQVPLRWYNLSLNYIRTYPNCCTCRHFQFLKSSFFSNSASQILLKEMDTKRHIIKLVVGLGNHSLINTRHSIGMMVLNSVAKDLGISWKYDKKCTGFIAQLETHCETVIFLKPKIPMNINGKSIAKTVSNYGIDHANIYLVHDHLDKPLGKIQLKLNGSAGGHNGVKSAISCLKTNNIKRFRIGIDRPTSKNDVVKYVLHELKPNEIPLVEQTIEQCTRLLEDELGIELNVNSMNCNDTASSSLETDKSSNSILQDFKYIEK